MSVLVIDSSGPLTSVQDRGRTGMLRHGVSASGPMDRSAFVAAAALLGHEAGQAGLEFTRADLRFHIADAPVIAGFAGGDFRLKVNHIAHDWPARLALAPGDAVTISPGAWGNYGYVRFSAEIGVPPVLGSRATNLTVGLGGFEGRGLVAGDRLPLLPIQDWTRPSVPAANHAEGPIRFTWGLHADQMPQSIRQAFVSNDFAISPQLDRMGVRLTDTAKVFAELRALSLVSDAVVCGDIQILGDGTPIILMRDHQPTGGYPRIATIISLDLDRLAQLRPGTSIRFQPVTAQRAHALRQFASRIS